MFALFLYNALLLLLSPLLLGFLLVRLVRGKEDKNHWAERWGILPFASEHAGTPRLWVHAVSVGEVMAAAPVLRELRACYPDALILLSTTTRGGREVAQKQLPPADFVAYYPLDFFPVVWLVLRTFRPDVIVLMEWEIWPNFLTLAKRLGAKIVVLNGRISDKGLKRGMKAAFWTRPALHAVDAFAMQSGEDTRRAALVGTPQNRLQTVGNTKFDEAVHPLTTEETAALRADLNLPANAPVWVCGSTRPGEEVLIAEAFVHIRQTLPHAALIVAPRHLDRANEAAAPFEKAGFSVRRRSVFLPPSDEREIILLDTFGELLGVYAVAKVAFVGGSLLPFGGQSVFQPLAQGTPAAFGPFMNNQRDIAALSQAEGVGFVVQNAQELAETVLRLLEMPEEETAALRQKARNLIARNQGVARRGVEIIAGLLGDTT